MFQQYADMLKAIPGVASKFQEKEDSTVYSFTSSNSNSLDVELSGYGRTTAIFLTIQGTNCAYWNTAEEENLDYHIKLAAAALKGDVTYSRSPILHIKEVCFKVDNVWHCTLTRDSGFGYIKQRQKLKNVRLNNKNEAIELLESELSKRRDLTYNTLCRWIEKKKKEHYTLKGNSGIDYQLDFFTTWDNKKLKTIRFWGNIDGGDVSAFHPLSSTFIKAPDDTFVGE